MKAAYREGQKPQSMLTQIPVERVIADEMHLILNVFDRHFLENGSASWQAGTAS